MPNVEKISIALTPEMAGAVREALRDWKRKRLLERQELEEIRRLWQEGLSSGPGRFESIEAIKAEARRRYEEDREAQ